LKQINQYLKIVRLSVYQNQDHYSSGLGLGICKSICDSLGWALCVESKEDKGTVVVVGLK